ncbi:RNA-binding domain-containing protein [Methanosarcina sp. Kolksee]|uniref:RNA-binding domain-containing protein n=1 Tax=Methanosarcina sp. Kolksee TaxID=1434099 RepID=UPI001E3ADC5C|nr:RNA-binding domain-containing protein [Methanosarcina sp. Kolksee]
MNRWIEEIIEAGEGYLIEFKESLDKSFIEEVCAFANSSGGKVILGVSDRGVIKGINTDNNFRSRIQDSLRQLQPYLDVGIEVKDNLIVVGVPDGNDKPYACSRGFFIRNGANSQKLTRNEIIEFFQKEGRIRFDELKNDKAVFETDFDEKAFENFLNLTGNITATDIYQPFLDKLMENAVKEGFDDRITTVCASMDDLPFEAGEFDIIWSEGSIFVIGFEKGLSYWKQFLKDEGYIALTESTWFTDEPSSEVLQFWQDCYPDIKSIPDTEKVIMAAGYDLIDRFKLPASTWYDFYSHLEKRVDDVSDNYKGNTDAETILSFNRKEIKIFREHPDEYGYTFFILQKKTNK